MLTEKAQKYLETLHRNPDYIIDKQDFEKYLQRYSLKDHSVIKKTVIQFSGYEFNGFNFYFITKEELKRKKPIVTVKDENQQYLKIDFEDYYLSEKGEICYQDLNCEGDGKFHAMCSSIEIMIEQKVFEQEYKSFVHRSSFWIDSAKNINFDELLYDFEKVNECCDQKTLFYKNDFSFIEILLHPDEIRLTILSIDKHSNTIFTTRLKDL